MAMQQPTQIFNHYEQHYDLTAQYGYQPERTLRHDVKMLHLMNKSR